MYGEDGVINMNNQMMNNGVGLNGNANGNTTSGNNQNTNVNASNNQNVNTGTNQSDGVNSNVRGNSMMRVQSGSSTTNANANQQNAVKKMPKNVKSNSKYTENWINIRSISNGVIYNDRNEMVTGVKIQPKNIFILDQASMDRTLVGLMNFYNSIDYEFWIIVADRPVDVAMYQAELQLLYNRTQDQRIRKVIGQDMDKGDFFQNNNVVDTEYFLLFKEKNKELLQKKIRNLINGLASAGLIASQTSNDDMRLIVDNFLNGGRSFESGTVVA